MPCERLQSCSFDHRRPLKRVTIFLTKLLTWAAEITAGAVDIRPTAVSTPGHTDSEANKSQARTPRPGRREASLEEPPPQDLSTLIRDFGVKSHVANCSVWHVRARSAASPRTGSGAGGSDKMNGAVGRWIGQELPPAGSGYVVPNTYWHRPTRIKLAPLWCSCVCAVVWTHLPKRNASWGSLWAGSDATLGNATVLVLFHARLGSG